MTNESDRYAYQINPEEDFTTAARILRLVGTGKRVLELGAASGSMTRAFKERNQCTVVGVEIDAAAAESARPYCERLIVGDIDTLDWAAEFGDERFDVVVAADVLEHLVDPWRCLEQTRARLTPAGYLVLSIPNVGFSGLLGAICAGEFPYQDKGLLDSTHLRFFTSHELEIALVASGYLPDEWERVELGAVDSEFSGHWQTLPEAVKAALAMNPEANTYQFVVRAFPADRQRWNRYLRGKKALVDEAHCSREEALLQAQEAVQQLGRAREEMRITADASEAQKAQRQELLGELREARAHLSQCQKMAAQRTRQAEHAEGELQAVLASECWRLTAPLRLLIAQFRRLQLVWIFLVYLARHPRKILPSIAQIYHDWRRAGLIAVKLAIIQLPFAVGETELWARYQAQLDREIAPKWRRRIEQMPHRPLISVLLPTYNTPEAVLRQTINSVVAQLYPDWQLCVADDGSTEPSVRRVLEEYAKRDSRIKVRYSETNHGIATATNQALELAEGEFVALLDHDDLLERQALYRLAESILADQPDFIYSDELLLAADGKDVLGYVFRPSFSLELLRAHPYIVHLVAFRTTLVRELGGLDVSLSISQDYDLILRVAEKAKTIVHIPEILYRWRQQQQSAGHQKKEQVMATSKRILEQHLSRCHEEGTVEDGQAFNFFDVRYRVQSEVRVAIIIPTKNHGELLRQCVESIERTVKQTSYEIVVIDHESDDPRTLAYLEHLQDKHRVLRYEGPFNFSAINNWAVSQLAEDDYTHYLFCNNDIEAVDAGWLERMVEFGQKPDVGIVGPTLYYPDNDIIQHAGVCVGIYGAAEHYGKWLSKWRPDDGTIHPGYGGSLIANHEMSAVTAACMLMRRDAFEKINGYGEEFVVGFGDVDLCLRTIQAGYRIIFCPQAALIHHESYTRGQSRGEDPHPEDSALFQQRWRAFLRQGDPYYSPHLSLHSTAWDVINPLGLSLAVNRRVFRRSS